MIFSIRRFTFLFILSTAYSTNILSQQKLFVESGKNDYKLGRYISILEDKGNKLSIYDAASDSMKNKYVYYNKETLNLRFTSSAFWLRFVVVDTLSFPSSGIMTFQNKSTWIIAKNDPFIEDVRLFYKDSSAGANKYIGKATSSAIPVRDKVIKTNDFISFFPVQKNVPDTVYLRVQTISQSIISFDMLTPGEYVIRSSNKFLFLGILFGIFFLLIAYNTLLYFSVKEKTYLFYVLYIFCYTTLIFIYEGYYSEIFGRIFAHDYLILSLAAGTCVGIFGLLFTREFLSTRFSLPWAYKLLTYLTFVGPINFICILVFASQIMTVVWAFCNLGSFMLGFAIAVITLKKGVYLAKYYLLASSGMTLGLFIFFSARNNLLPVPLNFWTQSALHFGILWEALIFAASVGYRFSFLKAEKEREKSLMRNQIAADLHDEIGSNLSTIYLQSRLLMKDPHLDNNSRAQLQNIANSVSKTTDIIRDIVWFINPFHDNSGDLVLRMKELASKMLISINYTFISNGSNENIFDLLPDLNKRRHIYLIFKETLNNIIKHSEANEVSILLSIVNKKFIMTAADNGKGFNEEETLRGEGLKNLRNRALHIGSKILIESNSGKGTKIILEVPL